MLTHAALIAGPTTIHGSGQPVMASAEAFAWQRDDPRSKSTLLLVISATAQQLGVQPTSAARNVSDDSRVG